MKRLTGLLLAAALCSLVCGCGSGENDKPKKKAFSGDPNKVFSAYIKSRSVGYTFRMQIIDAFSRLSENDKKAVAAEMQAFMDR